MKEVLFKLDVDCGRSGSLEGVFISTQEKVDYLIKSKIKVYFGEVLGKHSEIYGSIEPKEIIRITDDENVIKIVSDFNLCSGFDPFNYMAIGLDAEFEDMYVSEIVDILMEREQNKTDENTNS